MFMYEKTNDKKWPWVVTSGTEMIITELQYSNLRFHFPEKHRLFEFWKRSSDSSGKQLLIIYTGYAWDGCSGPVTTTARSARASCVHDVLYQSMREGLIGQGYRPVADKIFYRLLVEDGMTKAMAWGYYMAVRIFGAGCCKLKKTTHHEEPKE
jgi:hypothetical protein